MPYLGPVLAAVCGFATIAGLDRGAFYPTVTIVIASYYGLFAVMGGWTRALLAESACITVFLLISVIGFQRNLWLLVGALAGHGVFDFFMRMSSPTLVCRNGGRHSVFRSMWSPPRTSPRDCASRSEGRRMCERESWGAAYAQALLFIGQLERC